MFYLLLLSSFLLLVFSWVLTYLLRRGDRPNDDGDGGIEPWNRPPQLDLPPGVSLPIDDRGTPTHHREYEEELAL